MAKKKTLRRHPPTKKAGLLPGFAALQRRVATLETDFHSLRTDMGSLSDEVAGLKTVVSKVDSRTLRGEKMMMEMQGEQRRASKMIDRIAEHWKIELEPPVPPSADPGDEPPPDADEPE